MNRPTLSPMPKRNRSKIATLAWVVAAVFVFPACSSSKPSKSQCKQAIENIQKIRDTSKIDTGADPRRAIRSCQGNSSKKTVECFIAAKTLEDLSKCEGETGEKYFEQERKAQEEIEKKVKEKAAEEAEKKKEEGGDN